MQIPIRVEQEGFYIAQVSGGERGDYTFPVSCNMILNNGIARLLSQNANVLQYISVGTGNSPPHEDQDTLDQRIATTNRNAAHSYSYVPATHAPQAYGQTAFSVQFDRGQAAGNLSEVSVGWHATGLQNFSRALFQDSMGNPTTITVKDDEFLRITYILRRYVPIPWTGIMEYDDDGLPATTQVTVSPGTNTSTTGNGSGGNVRHAWLPSNTAQLTFVDNPQWNQLRWRIFFDLDYGNPAISSIVISSNNGNSPNLIPAGTTITFDPPIPKTNEFDVTIDLLLTVARRVP